MKIVEDANAYISDAGELILPCPIDELPHCTVMRLCRLILAMPEIPPELKKDYEKLYDRETEIINQSVENAFAEMKREGQF